MSFSKRKCFIILVVVATNLLLLECGARFFAFIDQPLLSGNQIFEEKISVMRHLDYRNTKTIFLVGDSTMNRAVYPNLLSAMLAKSDIRVQVVNLAFDGCSPDSAAKILEHAAEIGIKPELVLYDFCPWSRFRFDPPSKVPVAVVKSDQLKNIESSYMGRCVLCKRKRTVAGLICFMEDHSFLLRNRAYFKKRVLDFVETAVNPRVYEWKTVKPISDFFPQPSNFGWEPNHFMMTEEYYKKFVNDPNSNRNFLQMQAKIKQGPVFFSLALFDPPRQNCALHKVPFGVVFLPFYEPYFDRFAFVNGHDRRWLSQNLLSGSDSQSKFYTCEIDGLNNDIIYFNDPVHVNTFGAIETTKKLAAILMKQPYRGILTNAELAQK